MCFTLNVRAVTPCVAERENYYMFWTCVSPFSIYYDAHNGGSPYTFILEEDFPYIQQ